MPYDATALLPWGRLSHDFNHSPKGPIQSYAQKMLLVPYDNVMYSKQGWKAVPACCMPVRRGASVGDLAMARWWSSFAAVLAHGEVMAKCGLPYIAFLKTCNLQLHIRH